MSHATHLITRRALMLVASLCMLSPVWALDPPSGAPILTISGNVGAKNQAGAAVFDLAMLEALPQKTFVTNTPWDKQPTKFTGPLLRDVLAAARATGTTVTALALNDYKTSIPVEDARQFDVIVAHRINDQPISVRTKGPLFIIYPFDSVPELKTSKYYGRSAWQLKSLAID
jgi:hypothetical protein